MLITCNVFSYKMCRKKKEITDNECGEFSIWIHKWSRSRVKVLQTISKIVQEKKVVKNETKFINIILKHFILCRTQYVYDSMSNYIISPLPPPPPPPPKINPMLKFDVQSMNPALFKKKNVVIHAYMWIILEVIQAYTWRLLRIIQKYVTWLTLWVNQAYKWILTVNQTY